jgi:hypothetical protein
VGRQSIGILLGENRTELEILGWDLGLIDIRFLIFNFSHSREVSEFFHINQIVLAMLLFYHVAERCTVDEGDIVQGGGVCFC